VAHRPEADSDRDVGDVGVRVEVAPRGFRLPVRELRVQGRDEVGNVLEGEHAASPVLLVDRLEGLQPAAEGRVARKAQGREGVATAQQLARRDLALVSELDWLGTHGK